MTDAPRRDRVALSREYSDFLIELSIALHKFGMYPSGHPSLEPAAGGVVARAAHLLVDRTQVAFGVARRQLIIEGVATSPTQAVLRRLAEGLHRHHLGAVTVIRGVGVAEVAEALRALSLEPEQHGALGARRSNARLSWPHLRLHPLSFEGLSLSNEPTALTGGSSEQGTAGRGAELWIGLARAAVEDHAADAAIGDVVTEPDLIARAIGAHTRAAAYDQVIIGYLLQIAREIRSGSGGDTAALQRRTARLIGALDPQTLRRLIDMGGDAAQRREFVLDASQTMAVDAVLDIVKAAADVSGQTISHGLVRLLSKLAAHAEFGVAPSRPIADVALREQVGQLLTGWRLADPNPEAYGRFLQQLATTTPSPTAARDRPGPTSAPDDRSKTPLADLSVSLDPVRLVQMSLEMGDVGPMAERAIARVVGQGRAAELLTMVAECPRGAGSAADHVRTVLVQPEALKVLFAEGSAFDHFDRLQPLMDETSYGVLLDILATTENRTIRRKLIDRLARAPIDLGPTIASRLDDPRWFVQRNMLVLLERIGRVPKELSLAEWVTHRDVRVRHEAIRLQMTLPDERHLAVRAALRDGHARLVHSGLAAIQQQCPNELADIVGALAVDSGAPANLRVLAAQALGRCRDPRALSSLLQLTQGGRTLLGRPKLAGRSPVMLAALQALAGGWHVDSRAAAVVALAAESSDPEIQRAVRPEER